MNGKAFLRVKIANRWMYEEAMLLDDEGFPVESFVKTLDMKFTVKLIFTTKLMSLLKFTKLKYLKNKDNM